MKVIDLLNKKANGEEIPKKIVINDREWIYDGIDYARESDGEYLFDVFIEITQRDLNMEVEIIKEDKEIEELNLDADALKGDEIVRTIDYLLEGKINSLVKAVNELKKGK